ncbi:hypothetical protein E4T56_gene15006, partial [Termitomyces sp. T112]
GKGDEGFAAVPLCIQRAAGAREQVIGRRIGGGRQHDPLVQPERDARFHHQRPADKVPPVGSGNQMHRLTRRTGIDGILKRAPVIAQLCLQSRACMGGKSRLADLAAILRLRGGRQEQDQGKAGKGCTGHYRLHRNLSPRHLALCCFALRTLPGNKRDGWKMRPKAIGPARPPHYPASAGRHDPPDTGTKTDAAIAIPAGHRTDAHLVPVFQKAAAFAMGKGNGKLAPMGEFQKTSLAARRLARKRPGAQQVAAMQITAVCGMVGHNLAQGPVHRVPAIAMGQGVSRQTRRPHRRGGYRHAQVQHKRPGRLIPRVEQIGQRLRIALRPGRLGGSERCPRLGRDDPGGDGGMETFGKERSERLIFPRLNIACGPVVSQAPPADPVPFLGN